MDSQVAEASSQHEEERAPMAYTLLWLASLPVAVPTWLIYAACSKGWDSLRRSLRSSFAELRLTASAKAPGTASNTETQTELNMRELEMMMDNLAINADAVFSHRHLLDVSRGDNQSLRTQLEDALARIALMSQHNADLELCNQRLQGLLRDVVLPVLERLTESPEAVDVPGITADVLVALHGTKQVLVESEGCATAEASPVEKPGVVFVKHNTPRGDARVQLALLPTLALPRGGPAGSPLNGSARGCFSARQASNSPAQGVAKVWWF